MYFLSFRITSSYIVPFSCTYNGHQKSNCLLISSKLDVVKSLWNRLQSIVPNRIENGEKPCISKDFLVLCFTSRCRIGATPKRKASGSNPLGRTKTPQNRWFCGVFLHELLFLVWVQLSENIVSKSRWNLLINSNKIFENGTLLPMRCLARGSDTV